MPATTGSPERLAAGPPRGRAARGPALLLAAGFVVVVAFQASLAAGAPWGAAAYGGADTGRLSGGLRTASAGAAVFWLLAALTALSRGGLPSFVPLSVSRRAVWALAVLLAAGTVMNAASSSPWERFGWAPFNLVMTVLCLRLARATGPAGSAG